MSWYNTFIWWFTMGPDSTADVSQSSWWVPLLTPIHRHSTLYVSLELADSMDVSTDTIAYVFSISLVNWHNIMSHPITYPNRLKSIFLSTFLQYNQLGRRQSAPLSGICQVANSLSADYSLNQLNFVSLSHFKEHKSSHLLIYFQVSTFSQVAIMNVYNTKN